MRYTTFRFALAVTPAQAAILARHAGASRFAYNQCLQLVADALATKRTDPQIRVPWSGFDLLKAFNAWKKTEEAGRLFVVAPGGTITKQVTGLGWRREVSAQVFEEAAVDLGRALSAYAEAKAGKGKDRVGFPRRKRKGRCRDSFRLRNKQGKGGGYCIRIGEGHPRSLTLPTIGMVRVHDDTRRLRRLLRPTAQTDPDTGQPVVEPRAKVLFATVNRHGSRWYVSLNVQAPDFHVQRRHPPRHADDSGGFVGVDRGLAAFAVAATAGGSEVGRFTAPKPLRRGIMALRRQSRAVSRAQPRSCNRAKASRRLSRQHARIADTRRSFLHAVSSQLVQTHDRLCLEDLAVANLMSNRYLARPSETPPGPSSPANSAIRRPGSGPSWWSVTAGSHPPRPARVAGGSSSRWGWLSGSFAATRAGWPSTATVTPPPTSPPGPSATTPRLRTAKRAAGQPTPLEGKALAIAVAMAKPASLKGEPTPTPSWRELRTPEKGAAGLPHHGAFDRL
jgi:putative transposase